MGPKTTKGRRQVIEAATKRLAAAKAQKASARSTLKSANAVTAKVKRAVASAKYTLKTAEKNTGTAKRAMGAAQSELEMMAYTDHPHVARLFGSFEDEHTLYLVIEYCSPTLFLPRF